MFTRTTSSNLKLTVKAQAETLRELSLAFVLECTTILPQGVSTLELEKAVSNHIGAILIALVDNPNLEDGDINANVTEQYVHIPFTSEGETKTYTLITEFGDKNLSEFEMTFFYIPSGENVRITRNTPFVKVETNLNLDTYGVL